MRISDWSSDVCSSDLSANFDQVFAAAPGYADAQFEAFGISGHALTIICILLFIGAMGKSAQLGLHTWLPDAMEGPTPVPALIHEIGRASCRERVCQYV